MQLRRPSAARVLASHVRQITKLKSQPEKIFFYIVFMLVILICIVELFEGSSSAKSQGASSDKTGTPMAKVPDPLSTESAIKNSEMVKKPIPIAKGEPKLEIFVQKIRNALGPYTKKYISEVETAPLADDSLTCGVSWSSRRDGLSLPPCGQTCPYYETLKQAKAKCIEQENACGGVTQVIDGRFQPRPWGNGLVAGRKGERSWKKIPDYCKTKNTIAKSTARRVWDAFHDAVDAALEDDSLKLMETLYPVREDGSIFISIASYRDRTCAATLHKAFMRAKYPEKLSAGIVQQNCVHPTKCMTGTGWADTRRWVKSDGPDPDCAEEFCKSEFGKKHCDEGRVRILRLDEIDALGPFFTRFVNSKLWRGENYYLQIDAHTDFRQDWDESMAAQMRATKSYPYSVISNYPPSGTPNEKRNWAALKDPTTPDEWGAPSTLCGCTFENAGGSHVTVRLAQTGRNYRTDLKRPRRSLFVAAGFFVAHGSIVNNVGFDPFLPFLFMGEEIALSIRFYTNGYDIYGPSADVLRHEYVRKESPKFWESVGHVYSAPNLHNELTDLIVQRVQNLVHFPEADTPDKINPQTLLTRLDTFGLGKVRTAEQFVQVAGIDLKAKTQQTPQWCNDGGEPDDAVKPQGGIDVDLLH